MGSAIDGIAWLIAAFLVVCAGWFAGAQGEPRLRVLDGDTFELDGERIRLRGVDTPELKGPERELALGAKSELEKLLTKPFRVERVGKDKYGRTVANVFVGDRSVSLTLIESGHGRAYPLKLRKAEVEAVKAAEATAKKQRIGIWEKVK